MSNPVISITDFVAPPKADKPRAANPYDEKAAELVQFPDHTKAATLFAPSDTIAREVRKFREAVNHLGYRARERDRQENDNGVSVTFTVAKKKAGASDTDADDAEENTTPAS